MLITGREEEDSLEDTQNGYFQEEDLSSPQSPQQSFFKHELDRSSSKKNDPDDTVQLLMEQTRQGNILDPKLIRDDLSEQNIDIDSEEEQVNEVEGVEAAEQENCEDGKEQEEPEEEAVSEQAEEDDKDDDDEFEEPLINSAHKSQGLRTSGTTASDSKVRGPREDQTKSQEEPPVLTCAPDDIGNPNKDPKQIRKRRQLQAAIQQKFNEQAEEDKEYVNKQYKRYKLHHADLNEDMDKNEKTDWSDNAFVVSQIDYYRLHKFEDLKKVRKEVRDMSDDRKKILL